MNGRAFDDKTKGKFTYCGKQGMSTIDYVCCDKSMLQYITSFQVHDFYVFSDHAIVSFGQSIKMRNQNINKKRQQKIKARWKENAKEKFRGGGTCSSQIQKNFGNITNQKE